MDIKYLETLPLDRLIETYRSTKHLLSITDIKHIEHLILKKRIALFVWWVILVLSVVVTFDIFITILRCIGAIL